MAALLVSSAYPHLPEDAFHPYSSFVFPKKAFGKKLRSCYASYFRNWAWLSYNVAKDVVYCHVCVNLLQTSKMAVKYADPPFVQKGFSYWKDATIAFKKHESSKCHK